MPSKLIRFLRNQTLVFKRLAKKTRRKQAKDDVHLLRITVRRLRATLWILQHSALTAKPGRPLRLRSLNRKLKVAGKALGAVRELDIAVRDAERYQIDSASLRKKRKRCRQKLAQVLNTKYTNTIARKLEKVIENAASKGYINLEPALQKLRDRIVPWRRKKIRNAFDFHRLRIMAKKTRYAREAIGKPVNHLTDLQDILGKAHDITVLMEYVGRRPQLVRDRKTFSSRSTRLVKPALSQATS
jgi:CHAD domain-containing protein